METIENVVKKENRVLLVSGLVIAAITIGIFLLFLRLLSSFAHGIEIAEFLRRDIANAILAAVITLVVIVAACAVFDMLREGMVMLVLETAALGVVVALTFSYAASVYLAGARVFSTEVWFVVLPVLLAIFLFFRIWHGEETSLGRLSLMTEAGLVFAVISVTVLAA